MLSENSINQLSQSEPEWLKNKRLQAFKSFNELEIPSFRYGIGIHVDVSKLDLNSINPLENFDEWVISKPESVEVLSFEQALVSKEDLLKEFFMTKCFKEYEDKLTALHGSFFNHTLLIHIPENLKLKDPIQISVDVKSKTRIDHILVLAEKNSKARIIEISGSKEGSNQFRSQAVEIIAKEDSNVEYLTIQDLNPSTFNFSKRRGFTEKNASIDWVECQLGSKFTQSETFTTLKGENSNTKSNGIIFGTNEQCFDINQSSNHLGSNTISDMDTKTVLNDKAKTVYRGLVKINPNARNCEGYQKDDTILLSDEAIASAVPNLEIQNNDVKCSHGATISQIDEDKLFYMMSRGIDDKTAKRAIIEGFFDPVLSKIKSKELKNEIKSTISKRLGALE